MQRIFGVRMQRSRSAVDMDERRPPTTVIRAATSEDIPAMIAVEQDAPLAAHWPEAAYRRAFSEESPARIMFVATHDERAKAVCGFIIARLAAGECELENIVVASEHRNRGIGSELVQALVEAARSHSATRIFLEVRESNIAARAFYERCGFAIIGSRPSYYANPPEDAIVYALPL